MTSALNRLSNNSSPDVRPPNRHWRLVVVLLAALLVSAGQPLVANLLGEAFSFDLGVSLLIMAVLLLAFETGARRRSARAFGIAAFASLCAARLNAGGFSSTLAIISYLLTASLFAVALWGIIRTILVGDCWSDAILATVCGYLLLGIIWGLLYEAVETATPGSFRLAAGGSDSSSLARSDLGYFSFVTLSTVGYGDVIPESRMARNLAWMEAVVGQFYLAVLVAGLVGLRVSQRHHRGSSGRAHDAINNGVEVSSRSSD